MDLNDAMEAILNFLKTGKLPKPINSALVRLVRKVLNLYMTNAPRAIACPNVLYETITKAMSQRMLKTIPYWWTKLRQAL